MYSSSRLKPTFLYSAVANPRPEQIMICPYNKAHEIQHSRMQYHLEKCRKQHVDSKKVACPLNAKHVVNEQEMQYHMQTCPDRALFDNQRYVIDDGVQHRPLPPAPVLVCEENWEDEPCASYVPDPSKKAHIITKVKGVTPAERRKARMEGVRNYRPQ